MSERAVGHLEFFKRVVVRGTPGVLVRHGTVDDTQSRDGGVVHHKVHWVVESTKGESLVVARIRNSKGGHRRIAEVHVRIGIASHVHDVGTVVVVGSCGDPCAAVPVVVAVVKIEER